MVLLNASLEEILGDKPSLLEAVLHGLVINKNPYKSLLGKKVRRAQIEAAFPPFPVNQPFHSSDVLLSSNEQIVQPSAELSLVYHRTQIILIFISLIFLSQRANTKYMAEQTAMLGSTNYLALLSNQI